MDVSKNRGKTPKMDGENNGNTLLKGDDLGGFPMIFGNIHMSPVFGWVGKKHHSYRIGAPCGLSLLYFSSPLRSLSR